jgi:hypothetical protein
MVGFCLGHSPLYESNLKVGKCIANAKKGTDKKRF